MRTLTGRVTSEQKAEIQALLEACELEDSAQPLGVGFADSAQVVDGDMEHVTPTSDRVCARHLTAKYNRDQLRALLADPEPATEFAEVATVVSPSGGESHIDVTEGRRVPRHQTAKLTKEQLRVLLEDSGPAFSEEVEVDGELGELGGNKGRVQRVQTARLTKAELAKLLVDDAVGFAERAEVIGDSGVTTAEVTEGARVARHQTARFSAASLRALLAEEAPRFADTVGVVASDGQQSAAALEEGARVARRVTACFRAEELKQLMSGARFDGLVEVVEEDGTEMADLGEGRRVNRVATQRLTGEQIAQALSGAGESEAHEQQEPAHFSRGKLAAAAPGRLIRISKSAWQALMTTMNNVRATPR
mmetsp:Transcript_49939/g.113441  ORF Transcript_49939/g.113441 Transcript_49939/m.113441 type:complete len:363 (-) Transcript_49939:364-1452(-)